MFEFCRLSDWPIELEIGFFGRDEEVEAILLSFPFFDLSFPLLAFELNRLLLGWFGDEDQEDRIWWLKNSVS